MISSTGTLNIFLHQANKSRGLFDSFNPLWAGGATQPDIIEVAPLSEQDKPCLDEIMNVLLKHNALDQFGLALLHQHFDIRDDEVLYESADTM